MAYIGSTSALGVGSGMDLSTLLNNLMKAEAVPLNRIKQQSTSVQSQISAFGSLKSSLTTLQDAAKKLTTSNFTATTVSSSNEKIATVKASSNQASGNFSLTVQNLASASKSVSGQLASSYTSSQDTSISFEFASGKTVSVDVASGSSLSQIRDAINRADNGISATLVNEGDQSRLVFTSKNTGENNNFSVTTTGDTTLASAIDIAIDAPTATPSLSNATRTDIGADARFAIDGISLTSASNTVTNAISGLEITLLDTTDSTSPVRLNITQDASAPEKALNDFITAYNTMVDAVNKLAKNTPQAQGADPSERTSGPLAGDSTVRNIMSQLQNTLFSVVPGTGSPYNNLASIGVRSKQDGKIELNVDTFKTAMERDASGVAKLFGFQANSADTTIPGVTQKLSELVTDLTKTDGVLDSRVKSLNDTSRRLQDQQTTLEYRLTQIEANYRRQFTALDTMIANMQSQSSFLSQQLAGLANLR